MTPSLREDTSHPRRAMTARSYSRRILSPLQSNPTPINTRVITEPRPGMPIFFSAALLFLIAGQGLLPVGFQLQVFRF
jgi:hypothetical protein